MSLLLYALVRPTNGHSRLRGIRGERLRLVQAAGIGALVGGVSSKPAASPRVLRAYHDAVHRISLHHAAVVPVRFGTCVDDEQELYEIR